MSHPDYLLNGKLDPVLSTAYKPPSPPEERRRTSSSTPVAASYDDRADHAPSEASFSSYSTKSSGGTSKKSSGRASTGPRGAGSTSIRLEELREELRPEPVTPQRLMVDQNFVKKECGGDWALAVALHTARVTAGKVNLNKPQNMDFLLVWICHAGGASTPVLDRVVELSDAMRSSSSAKSSPGAKKRPG